MLPTHFFGSLAILSAVAPTLAKPYPSTFQHLNIPRTTLTERAITVPVCVKAKVEIPLGSVVNGLADSLRDDDNCGLLGLGCLVSDALTAVDNLLGGGKALNISLGSLCLCATVSALSPDTLAQVTVETGKADTGLLGALGGLTNVLLKIVEPFLLDLVATKAATEAAANTGTSVCSYPEQAIPVAVDATTCGTSCDYTCAAGYDRVDDECVPVITSLQASGVSRRRSLKSRSRHACRPSFSACPISTFSADANSYGGGFECINTQSNLESCGGCIIPFLGGAVGQDCTAIPNVDSVSCSTGRCLVNSCASGFTLSSDASSCEATPSTRYSASRLTFQSRRLWA